MTQSSRSIPASGRNRDDILKEMTALRERDVSWQDGQVFSLVFHAGDEALALLKEAYALFFSENGLNPTAFPSLRRFETDVVNMAADLMGSTGDVVGNMTSGGTESILMAMVTAREWARANRPNVVIPEVVLPRSAHPAFDKAAHYFDMKLVHVPVGKDLRADVEAMAAAITPSTILLVGSAPSYPHGLVDPIQDIAKLAQSKRLLCHVDACVGGFMLPFVRRAGYDVPDWDFSVPGVTSISADLHKYGYAAKGASVILYHNSALRRHQLFAVTEWSGGIYASPTMGGTKPGGAIAAAWAIMNYLGVDGYTEIAGNVMATANRIKAGINAIDGLHVMGDPPMSLLAIGSDTLDVYEVSDEMGARGWHLDRQHYPPTLHMTINCAHIERTDDFLRDLAETTGKVQKLSLRRVGTRFTVGAARTATRVLPEQWVSRLTGRAASMVSSGNDSGVPGRSAAMYGMMGTLPNRGDLKEVVLDLLESFSTPQED
jgi:glutamate/tyrosine decarboxylase-like PLP-dependent enzyme